MVDNGVEYNITDIFGVWALSNDDDLAATHSDVGVWNAHEQNAGTGGIAGWKTNPNTGVTPNGSFIWTFDSLNASSVEQHGFHIRLNGNFPGWGGQTGYATVPEPAGYIALLMLLPMCFARKVRAKTR
jgi:hypothetical protein